MYSVSHVTHPWKGASSGIVEQFVRNLQRALPERKIKQKRELQVPFAPSTVAGYTYLDFADPENEGIVLVAQHEFVFIC